MPSSEIAVNDTEKMTSREDDGDNEDEIPDGSPPRDSPELPMKRIHARPKPLSLLPFFRSAAAEEKNRQAEIKGEPKRRRPVQGQWISPVLTLD